MYMHDIMCIYLVMIIMYMYTCMYWAWHNSTHAVDVGELMLPVVDERLRRQRQIVRVERLVTRRHQPRHTAQHVAISGRYVRPQLSWQRARVRKRRLEHVSCRVRIVCFVISTKENLQSIVTYTHSSSRQPHKPTTYCIHLHHIKYMSTLWPSRDGIEYNHVCT